MKRHWSERELTESWSLTHDERELARNRTDRSRFGFAALLKFFQVEGRFPSELGEIPNLTLDYLASQLDVPRTAILDYKFTSRSAKRDRMQIRELLGFRQATVADGTEMALWLRAEVLPAEHKPKRIREAVLDWCRRARIEPPSAARLDRIIGSATNDFESLFFATAIEQIPLACRVALDGLLKASDDEDGTSEIERRANFTDAEPISRTLTSVELCSSTPISVRRFSQEPTSVGHFSTSRPWATTTSAKFRAGGCRGGGTAQRRERSILACVLEVEEEPVGRSRVSRGAGGVNAVTVGRQLVPLESELVPDFSVK